MRRRGEANHLSWLPKISAAAATSLLVHVAALFVFLTWFRTGGELSAPLPSYTAVLLQTTSPKPQASRNETAINQSSNVGPLAAIPKQDTQPDKPLAAEAAVTPTPMALPPAPAYKPRVSLEKGPMPLVDIEPKYPPEAGGVQGTVVLRLLINEEGGVDDASVVSAFPPALFDAAAVEAFRGAVFSPGRQLGVPVKSQLVIEVKFQSFNKGVVGGRSL